MKIKLLHSSHIKNLNGLSVLHKKSLKKTIATTLSANNLAKLYSLLIECKYLNAIVAMDKDNNIVGGITFKNFLSENKIFIIDYFKIFKYIFSAFVTKPHIWLIEGFYKIGIYKNIDLEINILTLFVDQDNQNMGIAKSLIEYVEDNFEGKLSVDTRSDNKNALKFYIDQNFKIVNENKKNISLIKE
tara:strand:+ start:199 stop:759 length:561 start_codon:yes stop_codon:yes gene_type:complete